jgi:hypothetical protein
VTARDHEFEAQLPLDPANVAICASTRMQVAASGATGIAALLRAWEGQPTVRHGVIVTFGMMLWYADSAGRPLSPEHRTLVRRHLLRASVAEESWLRQAFLEAAEWTHDATYLPLVRGIDPRSSAVAKLENHLLITPAAELHLALREQFDVAHLEGWLPDEGLARSVRTSFTSAAAAFASRDHRAVRAALTAAQLNLRQARGTGVRVEAWTLLSEGIGAILARIATP